MRASRLALLPVLLGVTAASAVPAHGAAREGPEGQTVNVVVHNRANAEVRVYVLQRGHMVPLGLVEAAASETFGIPSAAVQSSEQIQLVADPLSSTDWYRSDPVSISPSSEVDFTIASTLDRSSVSVKK